ncbi:cytochrome-c peroxidase [Gilvibacter sediminis]|uniref:cytochrome-c peroxidase n=1 Tax=Gilvibacter sediminis TaxID=379071 RepID=UPI0023505F5C|nr:cytochrome c peroxidase [Gilvibacter sediminis]MDC7997258.1 cytochrome c peroxidase [Gilvibacter sediminis]
MLKRITRLFRSDNLLLLVSILLTLLLISASKPHVNKADSYRAKAIGFLNQKFQEELQYWKAQTASFDQYAQVGDTLALQRDYKKLRGSYKQIEFMLEYLDKEAVDRNINGAPLPKLEPKVAEHVVLEPKGLQVIDELMGAATLDLEALQEQTALLLKNTEILTKFLTSRKFTDRQFFESSRQAMLRLMTLGITGFDTPGTLMGIGDAHQVLQSLKSYAAYYQSELQNINQLPLWDQLSKRFDQGIAKTAKGDFDRFDRLRFLNEVANPIYKLLLDIHLSLGYETIEEVSRYLPAVNYEATSLFSPNLLDPFYYSSVPNDSLFDQRAALGKLLFYDPVLSADNEMSCASCHNPKRAFTDGVPKSLSNQGEPLKRNALTLNYAIYATGYFHDLRAKRLEDQFEHVVLSQDEFDTNYRDILNKLSSSPTYSKLFAEAFPEQAKGLRINNIDYALAAYVMKLNRYDSALDRFFAGDSKALTAEQRKGFNLFTGKAACATCHFMPLFSGTVPPLFNESESEVLGIPMSNQKPWILDADIGRRGNGLEKEKADFYSNSFKTPTLRNIALTGPYMHNGVFNSLEEVMEFYNLGGGAGAGMDLEHQTLASDPLGLTQQEIDQLIAFMQALTDDGGFNPPSSLPRDFEANEVNVRPLGR